MIASTTKIVVQVPLSGVSRNRYVVLSYSYSGIFIPMYRSEMSTFDSCNLLSPFETLYLST